MREHNRFKLAKIKRDVLIGLRALALKKAPEDNEYGDALRILSDAIIEIEKKYGPVDQRAGI